MSHRDDPGDHDASGRDAADASHPDAAYPDEAAAHRHDLRAPTDLGPVRPTVRLVLTVLAVLACAAAALGLVLTWPSAGGVSVPEGYDVERVGGEVLGLDACEAGADCLVARVAIDDGPQVVVNVPSAGGPRSVDVGDQVVMGFNEAAPPEAQYSFLDVDRSTPVLSLVVVFGLAVLVLSRWRGFVSLLSLAVTLIVVGVYLLPALLGGSPPLLIALITAAVVMVIAVYGTYGVGVRSTVTLVGTLLGLVTAGLVGLVFIRWGHLTGISEESPALQNILDVGSVDTRGLLLAGVVIGALGVLDDVTVTQTATVWEIAAADPDADRRTLYAAAMRVGRSHVSATVNTLVLAYVGASLPLLLLFSALGTSWSDVVLTDGVATEVVRALAGSLGILAAVPLTTAVAAWAVPRRYEPSRH